MQVGVLDVDITNREVSFVSRDLTIIRMPIKLKWKDTSSKH